MPPEGHGRVRAVAAGGRATRSTRSSGRVPGQPRDRSGEGHRRRSSRCCHELAEHRHDLAYEIDGVVVKVDDLALHARSAPRRGRRAGPSPSSSRPRSAPPLLIDIHGLDRPDRPCDAVRPARAGLRRRLDRAAWPRLHNEDQVRLKDVRPGRPRHRSQGGRRHPRGRRARSPVARARRSAASRGGSSRRLPGLRSAARSPRGRERHATAPTSTARRSGSSGSCTSRPARRWTSRASASNGSSSWWRLD